MKKVLLDTNAYVRLLTGSEAVLDVVGEADRVYMSIFVLGELFAGFAGGTREKENREVLDRFLRRPPVRILNATSETAEIFGVTKHNLKRAGTPVPINDVWIAAHAAETGSVLVTFDRHFERIGGLRLWTAQ